MAETLDVSKLEFLRGVVYDIYPSKLINEQDSGDFSVTETNATGARAETCKLSVRIQRPNIGYFVAFMRDNYNKEIIFNKVGIQPFIGSAESVNAILIDYENPKRETNFIYSSSITLRKV